MRTFFQRFVLLISFSFRKSYNDYFGNFFA